MFEKNPPRIVAAANGIERQQSHARSLPIVDGKWTTPGVFEISTGENRTKIAYSHGHLKREYGGGPDSLASISHQLWHQWLTRPCLDLDPNINGGRIRAFRAKNSKVNRPDGKGRQWVTVWLADDVSTICKAWKETNRSPAGYKGRWMTSDVWEDDEWGPMLRDAEIAKHLKREQPWVSEQRQEQHEVLGGKPPRFREVPALVEDETSRDKRMRVHVSVLDDYKKIEEHYQRDGAKKLPTQQPQGKLTVEEIGQRLGVAGKDRIVLGFVLRHFRDKHPDRCEQFAVSLSKRRARRLNQARAWAYDFDAFKRWKGHKSLKELKAEMKPDAGNGARAERKLARGIRFFQYVLTRGEFTPESFGRFIAHPPKGELQPCKPVPLSQIWEWAHQAGLTWKKLDYSSQFLSAVMKDAGVKVKREWNKRFCYFSDPISLPQAEREFLALTTGKPTVKAIPAAKKRRGPRRSATTHAVYTACYDLLAQGKSRRVVLRIVHAQFSDPKYASSLPKEQSHVTTYAKRRAQDPDDPRPWPIPGKRG